jgi:ABC-type amino acid transport system permease subunit
MIMDLLVGLPGQRPGGLVLTILLTVGSAAVAVVLGVLYATICVHLPRISLVLQGAFAILRGIPLLLLVFALAQLTSMPLPVGGFVALLAYSLCHVGETLRGYLAAYPRVLRDQSRLLCLGWAREWTGLRLPWTLRRALDTLATHWIDLLKDTGALTVLGIGELTTVARLLSEQASSSEWKLVLSLSALLYLGTTLTLIRVVKLMQRSHSYDGEVAT